jgi:two-component sensor histidine kinase
VVFNSDQANWRLEVSDDGIGLPANIDVKHVNSTGSKLIQLLAQQVHGNLGVIRDGGTRFSIRFHETLKGAYACRSIYLLETGQIRIGLRGGRELVN